MKDEDFISAHSGTCSSVCRQIAFALGALSWSIVYTDLENECIHTTPVLVLILIIIYFFVDILQYLYSYIKMRTLIYIFDRAKYHPDYSKDDRDKMHGYYLEMKIKVEQKTYLLFLLKISILPFILLFLACYFLKYLQ